MIYLIVSVNLCCCICSPEFGQCCKGFKAKEEIVLGHKQKLSDLSNCLCESLLLHL
jgi:hypothetical protein